MSDELKEKINKINNRIDQVNGIKTIIDQIIDNGGYKDFIISLMLIENNEMLSTNNYDKYETAYFVYMENDDITLLSQEINEMLNGEE